MCMARSAVTGLLVLAASLCALPRARAGVQVRGQSQCLDAQALSQDIDQLVQEARPQGAAELLVVIELADTSAQGTHVALRIDLPDGSPGLARDYDLTSADCASASELLLTVIAAFLEELPITRWSAPTAAPPVEPVEVTEPFARATPPSVRPFGSVHAGPLLGLDRANGKTRSVAELELGGDLGLRWHRQSLSLGMSARSGLAQDLGAGQFRASALLARLRYQRHSGRHSQLRWGPMVQLGSLRVAGSGFAENFSRYLLWVEAGAGLGYRVGDVELSAQLWGSPIRQQVAIENRSNSEQLPRWRLGLSLEYAFGATNP